MHSYFHVYITHKWLHTWTPFNTDVKITVSSLKIQHAITSSTVQKHMYTSLNHENMCNQC